MSLLETCHRRLVWCLKACEFAEAVEWGEVCLQTPMLPEKSPCKVWRWLKGGGGCVGVVEGWMVVALVWLKGGWWLRWCG